MDDKWEKVSVEREGDGFVERTTARLKVDGGYLYRVEVSKCASPSAVNCSVALCFVPADNRVKKLN